MLQIASSCYFQRQPKNLTTQQNPAVHTLLNAFDMQCGMYVSEVTHALPSQFYRFHCF